MAMLKIRRDGHSVVLTIPIEELQRSGLAVGAYVNVSANEQGQILADPVVMTPRAGQRQPDVRRVARQIMRADRAVLDRLADS